MKVDEFLKLADSIKESDPLYKVYKYFSSPIVYRNYKENAVNVLRQIYWKYIEEHNKHFSKKKEAKEDLLKQFSLPYIRNKIYGYAKYTSLISLNDIENFEFYYDKEDNAFIKLFYTGTRESTFERYDSFTGASAGYATELVDDTKTMLLDFSLFTNFKIKFKEFKEFLDENYPIKKKKK